MIHIEFVTDHYFKAKHEFADAFEKALFQLIASMYINMI